jgi:hypothetical protein
MSLESECSRRIVAHCRSSFISRCAFIGEVNEAVARDIDTEVGRIIAAPFEITLEGAGSFGGASQLRSGPAFAPAPP